MLQRLILICIFSTLLFTGVGALAEQQPFTITISTRDAIFKVGEPIHLRVTLKNISSKEIRLAEAPGAPPPAEYQYRFDVRDGNGRHAALTNYARTFMRAVPPSGSRVTLALQPGETSDDETALNKLYDLARPGTYVVQVTRAVPEYLGKGIVKSNALTITIVD